MSTEVDLLKKLVNNDMVLDAVEVPKTKIVISDDPENILSRFEDDDQNYAHFLIRVKRSNNPLPIPSDEPQPPQLSIDSMVNETLQMAEQIQTARVSEQVKKAETSLEDSADYDPDFLTENATILEQNGDYALARNIYQTLVRRGQSIPLSLAGMARTYEKEGRLDRAIRCYQEAIAYSSDLPYYQAIAAIYIRQGNDQEAADSLVHALGIADLNDETRFELHKSIGNCFTRIGNYSKAEHHYRKAFELNSGSDALQVNVGSLALQKNDLDAALTHFERAIELNSSNDKAISGIGMIHLARNQLREAHRHFVRSLHINPNNLATIYNLVKCAYELRDFNEAAAILRHYIEHNPVNLNILYSFAGILFHQRDFAGAARELAKILKENPAHAGAKELQQMIAMEGNDHEGTKESKETTFSAR